MVILSILLPSAAILIGAGVACLLPVPLSSLSSKGPHGLSEILYAFSSASQNNGSAFAGLNANTVFYNVMLGLCMIIGRFGVIIPGHGDRREPGGQKNSAGLQRDFYHR